MPEYLSPGVYIEEVEGPQPIQPVGTSTGAFVGLAQFGPVNSPQLITNYTQFANTFGGFLSGQAYLAYAVQNFFNEGGTRCYVVRVFKDLPTATGAYPDAAQSSLTLSGLSTDTAAVNVYANSPGTWGNAVSVQVLADTFDPANAPVATIAAAGSGYQANDVLSVAPGSGGQVKVTLPSGGSITISAVTGTGAIAVGGFTVTAPGSGYPPATVLTTSGGHGTGATFVYTYPNGPNAAPTVIMSAGGSGYQVGDVLSVVSTGVGSVSLVAAGTGYPGGVILTSTGGTGSGATFTYTYLNPTNPTAAPTVAVSNPGSGYSANDVLTLAGPADRTITVNSVAGSTAATPGAVVTFTLTSPGTGYPSENALAVTGGAGSGATFNYKFNPNLEFQVQVSETAAGSTVPTVVETYTHVSLIELNSSGLPNQNHIEQRINGVSNYIIVHDVTSQPPTAPLSPQSVNLSGGTDGLNPTTGMFASDMIGLPATALVPASGLYAFDPVDDINIVAIPDLMLFAPSDGRNATLQAITYCQNRADCFYVADSPSGLKPQDVLAYKRGQNKYSGNAFNSKYAAIYYPWIYVSDPTTGGTLEVPPSGAIVGRYSATDVARGVFKAPAGTVDGYINSAMNIERVTTQGEQDTLNPEGINVIRKFADAGIVIWGARTVSSDSEWTYVPVRRLVISIEQSILLGTQGIVFEPNDPALWKRIIRDVGAFLQTEWTAGALFGDTAAQAYFVKCDSETNPPESIALGRVVTVVGIAPVLPAEFVIFQIELFIGGGIVSES